MGGSHPIPDSELHQYALQDALQRAEQATAASECDFPVVIYDRNDAASIHRAERPANVHGSRGGMPDA